MPGILRWLLHQHNVSLPKHRVFFFDDKSINVRPFSQTGFNARQVSCASRDYRSVYEQGYCGGVPEEVVPILAKVGGWEIFWADDLRKAAPLWFEYTKKVRQDPRAHFPLMGSGDAFITKARRGGVSKLSELGRPTG